MAVLPSLRCAAGALVVALIAAAPAPAAAALNRCTDRDGRVTFTERACSPGDDQAPMKAPMKAPAPATGPVPAGASPPSVPRGTTWVKRSERCTALEQSVAEWGAKMQAQTVHPPPYDPYPLQQRRYYEERYRKECIDERAWQDAQKQQAAQREAAECPARRSAIASSQEFIANNPNRYELVAREREKVLRNEQYLRERCR